MRQIFRCVMIALSLSLFAGLASCDKEEAKENGQTENNRGANQNEGDKKDPNDSNGSNGAIGNHEYVDLGLPSGTLWATCNIGATSPEEYGDYFAWGETETKETYTSENSKWYNVENTDLLDANGNLVSEYDVATVNWGKNWRMPTKAEIIELSALKHEFVVTDGVTTGIKFIGSNGTSLFLPFAGGRGKPEYEIKGFGWCWSATTYEENYGAYCINLHSWTGKPSYDLFYRCYGLTVRPVVKK